MKITMDKYLRIIAENPELAILASSIIIILATIAAFFITINVLKML